MGYTSASGSICEYTVAKKSKKAKKGKMRPKNPRNQPKSSKIDRNCPKQLPKNKQKSTARQIRNSKHLLPYSTSATPFNRIRQQHHLDPPQPNDPPRLKLCLDGILNCRIQHLTARHRIKLQGCECICFFCIATSRGRRGRGFAAM
jgi:hypothetical protein